MHEGSLSHADFVAVVNIKVGLRDVTRCRTMFSDQEKAILFCPVEYDLNLFIRQMLKNLPDQAQAGGRQIVFQDIPANKTHVLSAKVAAIVVNQRLDNIDAYVSDVGRQKLGPDAEVATTKVEHGPDVVGSNERPNGINIDARCIRIRTRP